jgi:hypothetical protein
MSIATEWLGVGKVGWVGIGEIGIHIRQGLLLLFGGGTIALGWIALRRSVRIQTIFAYSICMSALFTLLVVSALTSMRLSDPDIVRGYRRSEAHEVLEAFEAMDPQEIVASNVDDFIYLFTGRPAYRLPQLYDLYDPEIKVDDYEAQVNWLRDVLGEDGIIVYIPRFKRYYLPSEQELTKLLPLNLVVRTSDGAIYRIHHKP